MEDLRKWLWTITCSKQNDTSELKDAFLKRLQRNLQYFYGLERGHSMKHPVDTSQWGEFVVGELFDVQLSDGDNKPLKTSKRKDPSSFQEIQIMVLLAHLNQIRFIFFFSSTFNHS